MQKLIKYLTLFLCAVLVLSLTGCTAKPVETTPPTTEPPVTTVPTEPPAEDVYAEARAPLDNATDITLETLVTTLMRIGSDEFSEENTQTLTFLGLGSDTLQISLDEETVFNIHVPEDEESDDEDEEPKNPKYHEVYADGILYATAEMDTSYQYSGVINADEAAARYLPVVLLDASLYGSVTSESGSNGTTITFSEPTAAESWAMPEDAQMLEASGTAIINTSGKLEQMNYSITYQYGPAEYQVDYQSKPLAETAAITVPENVDDYPELEYVDLLRKLFHSSSMVGQADAISTSGLESVFSQAAGVIRNQSVTMNMHGRKEDTKAKIETSIFLKDYNTNQDNSLDQEELYIDGKFTSTVDDGVPTIQPGIHYEDIREYCGVITLQHMLTYEFWESAVCTDLGSLYLVEYNLSEDFGNSIQNSICNIFWNDPAFLNKMASAYVTNETTGYVSFDKYTNLPTAAGFYYEGTHTIDGMDYKLTLQSDQSIVAPSKGAYHEITEEMPVEAEPENKPTPLFYHVTGENGQEMWLLGTIHVGDERTAYLPQEIYDAFTAADALALEINSKAFDEQLEEDEKLQDKVSDAYYYSDGTTVESLLEEEDYALAVQYMKATGNYNVNTPYLKASLWSQSIDNFYLRQGYALHGGQGVEERLHQWAEEQEKEIREVESSLFQIKMMTDYSDELQTLLLEDIIDTSALEYWNDVQELYEKWCAGDEDALREAINEEVDTSEMTDEELAEYEEQKPLVEEYDKAMSFDRNEGMLKVATEYLESGETVFYAVGLAHLLDDANGLVDTLREAGYTVELVSYAG